MECIGTYLVQETPSFANSVSMHYSYGSGRAV